MGREEMKSLVGDGKQCRYAAVDVINESFGANVYPDPANDPIGIDFTGVSYSSIERCSLRGHVAAIVGQDTGRVSGGVAKAGGQYVSVHDCELASCYYGAWLNGANAWRIYDGRVAANRYGIWCTRTTGSRLLSTFESNGLGVVFASGAGGNGVSHSYFEGNGRPDLWSQLPFEKRGAVRFDDGSDGNSEVNNLFSNSEDTVVNNSRGVNVSQTAKTVAAPAAPTGIGAGQNLLVNGDFASWRALDYGANQLATGWVLDPPFPAREQQRLLFDSTQHVIGTGSQQWHMLMSDTGLSQRALRYVVPVTQGQWYAFSGWTRVSGAPERFSLRIGNTLADSNYYYSGRLHNLDAWQFHRQVFRATSTAVVIYVENEAPTGSGDFWMDAFKLEAGQLPTAFAAPNLFTEGLRTFGPPLVAASEIAPTHAVHQVTGTATIRTIRLPSAAPDEPAVCAGELVLIPGGPQGSPTWKLATGGNIALDFQARPLVPVRCIFDPNLQKWFVA